MNIDFTQLLAHYGYLALIVGCLLEGETILLLAGFAAHQGYLSLPLVILLAFASGTLGDQFFYLLGRHFGMRLLSRLPNAATRVDKVNRLLLRYHRGLIVAVRFMYGLRVIGPVIIGNSGVTPGCFVLFNMLGAALWATLVAGCGYLFGQTLQWLFIDLRHYELRAMLILLLCALILAGARHWRHRSD